MELALILIACVAVIVFVSTFAGKVGTSAPLLLTVLGIALSYLPGFPGIEINNEVVMLGLLPPLLYTAALHTSLIDLRANLRNISMLSVGLVVFTAVGVGLLLHWLIGIPLPLAIAFGGVVAPPDAVAATAVARTIGLPKQLVMILEGESLFNDATALVIVRMGLVAMAATVSPLEVGLQFLWAAGAGAAIGVGAMFLIRTVRGRLHSVVGDTALSFICPWIAYLPAEELHASGVMATVICGVLLGHQAYAFQSAASRLAERTTWTTVQYLLENGVFLLIGLQAKSIIQGVDGLHLGWDTIIGVSAATLATIIVLRPLWMVLSLPWWRAETGWRGRLRVAMVSGWAGMRGVVTLAAVLSIPEDAPLRPLLVLLALVVVAGTLLLQGYTLPLVARLAGIAGDDPREEALQRALVVERAVDAGNHALESADTSGVAPEVVTALRNLGERRRNLGWERLGGESSVESDSAAYRRLRSLMLDAERAKLLKIRSAGQISSDVLDSVLSDVDLEEAMLTSLQERAKPPSDATLRAPEHVRGACAHLDEAGDGLSVRPLTPAGCAECLSEHEPWMHLRICLECGHVGCCDSSPGRHASAHFESTGHPVMRSFEPGEEWRWCFVDSLVG